MEVEVLYNRISADNKFKLILDKLGMHHISDKGNYITCGMPDGNNPNSTVIYKNTFLVEAHTRNIEDKYGHKNLISLVMFIKKIYFLNAIKWVCKICDYDYYGADYKKPKLLSFLDNIKSMRSCEKNKEKEIKNEPLNENILNTYLPFCNTQFCEDGINKQTQRLFQIGYDLQTHRIIIPIRDEFGTLVGIKGRYAGNDLDCDNKYIYLFKCNKSNMLFGLDKTYEYIMEKGIVYVAEAEKAVMQGWTHGIKNIISIGGHSLSRQQVKKLTHLGVEVCLCYDDKVNFKIVDDKEVEIEDFYKKEKEKFIDSVKVTCIRDRNNKILENKESPFDKAIIFDELLKMIEVII